MKCPMTINSTATPTITLHCKNHNDGTFHAWSTFNGTHIQAVGTTVMKATREDIQRIYDNLARRHPGVMIQVDAACAHYINALNTNEASELAGLSE